MKPQVIDAGADTMARSFFIKGKKTIIVDTGRPGKHQAILKALEANGIKRSDVSLILLTHGHEDHTGNVPELAEALGVPVAMGKADATYVARGLNAPLKPRTMLGRVTTALVGPKTRAFETDILIDGALDLSPYGVDATAFPTPGHTAGSISISTAGSCLIGDLLMSRYMVAGGPGLPRLIEVPEAMRPSVEAVIARKPEIVYPAHGVPWRAEQVRQTLAGLPG
ncbi:MBL fold metallo-hydrolase [Methanocella sp. MCL-LM]|uniref:MBL fold metallo-hydrolase n=1 Tax=Methanocella sp. MCL-LM TaxID=3412035 RepID=UPI003C766FD9